MSEHDSHQSSVPLKRLKASRACDQCRKLRTRCDEAPLPPSSHSLELSSVLERKCKRCLRLNIDCTFILPIGETRDRPKKADSPGHVDSKEHESPTGSAISRPAVLRKYSSISSQPSNILEPLEKFKHFLDQSLPIIASKEISHNTSVLLTCCVRLVVASFTEPLNGPLQEQIQSSISMYFVQKQAITTPTMHNVQSLLLLSLFAEEPGAGNKFVAAIRMACAMHWNHPGVPNSDRNPAVSFIWWTLVTQDVWLYVYTGIPPFIEYNSFNTPRPTSPSFFNRITSLTEVLRVLIRPVSVGEYVAQRNPIAALKAWEDRFLQEIYPAGTPAPSLPGGIVLDSQTFVQILHSTVLAIFALQDPYFATTYSQYKISTPSSATSTSPVHNFSPNQTNGHEQSYMTASPTFLKPLNNVLAFLLATIQTHIYHADLFSRLGYFYRFSEICVLATLRVERFEMQNSAGGHTGYSIQHAQLQQQNEERGRLLAGWRDLVGETRWARVFGLSDKVMDGWMVVADLNDDLLAAEDDGFQDYASSATGETGSEYGRGA